MTALSGDGFVKMAFSVGDQQCVLSCNPGTAKHVFSGPGCICAGGCPSGGMSSSQTSQDSSFQPLMAVNGFTDYLERGMLTIVSSNASLMAGEV